MINITSKEYDAIKKINYFASLDKAVAHFVYTEELKAILDYMEKQGKEIDRLEEINKEHQKINGELQEKLTRAEEIIKGKCIQELGTSDLYKED